MSLRVAVLGAGVMGSSVAIFLARRGVRVTLFDEAPAPLQGASRWNEGKIHLGFLYAADPSLDTARSVIEGGLSFAPLMRELVGQDLGDVTPEDDVYLIHRNSIVSAHDAAGYYARVAELVREHPGARSYLTDATSARVRALAADELAATTDTRFVEAGFACPERSVSTVKVSDLLAGAIDADPRIELAMNTRIEAAAPEGSAHGRWRVGFRRERLNTADTFDYVVNALWHGRIAIDASAGLHSPPGWSHRYRVSAFVRTARPVRSPSAVVSVGPFGDVKNYNGRDFYLSWYPAGLLAASEALEAPRIDRAALEPGGIASAIEQGLQQCLPCVSDIFAAAVETRIEGGYVFAMGKGVLNDLSASVHRRDRFGVARRGNYISVDTGKYSSAPLLARQIAQDIRSS